MSDGFLQSLLTQVTTRDHNQKGIIKATTCRMLKRLKQEGRVRGWAHINSTIHQKSFSMVMSSGLTLRLWLCRARPTSDNLSTPCILQICDRIKAERMALIGLLPCRISPAQQTQSKLMCACVCVRVYECGIYDAVCWVCKQQIRTSAFMSHKLVKGGGTLSQRDVRQLSIDPWVKRMSDRMQGQTGCVRAQQDCWGGSAVTSDWWHSGVKRADSVWGTFGWQKS